MTPEALCIEGCGRPAKPGYRGWCKPCGDTPIEPGTPPATPDLCVAEGCDEWAVNFDTLCVKHRAFEKWRQSGKKAGTRLRRGRRFGRLKTIERVDDYLSWDGYRQLVVASVRWRCLCDCGRETISHEINLLTGAAQSCGCVSWEKGLHDLKGQRFGRLLVVERGPNTKSRRTRWWCRCDCGEMKLVTSMNLKSGMTRSCGCYQREKVIETHRQDLVGRKFNRLTVLEPLDRGFWLCRCDCGNETRVTSYKLKKGHTKSCGCFSVEQSTERIRRLNASRQQG